MNSPHAIGWRDLDTPLGKMGSKAIAHPKSTFVYTPSYETDIRKTFAKAATEIKRNTTDEDIDANF